MLIDVIPFSVHRGFPSQASCRLWQSLLYLLRYFSQMSQHLNVHALSAIIVGCSSDVYILSGKGEFSLCGVLSLIILHRCFRYL